MFYIPVFLLSILLFFPDTVILSQTGGLLLNKQVVL